MGPQRRQNEDSARRLLSAHRQYGVGGRTDAIDPKATFQSLWLSHGDVPHFATKLGWSENGLAQSKFL
jgi:hypothetical protein